jgi:hypothetical protein
LSSNIDRKKKKRVTFAEYTNDEEEDDIVYNCLEQVRDICDSLPTGQEDVQSDRLAFVLDDKRNLWKYLPGSDGPRHEIQKNCVSLEQLISPSPHQSKGLKPRQCITLAVTLASSLLQLHATPWLPEDWCNTSIYFPLNGDQPYVKILLQPLPALLPPVQDHYLNPYIVHLGIVLLELSQGKLFAEWVHGRNDITLRPNDIKDKASAALKWLKEGAIFKNVGEAYPQVVELCLECSFSPVQSQNTLSNEKFRSLVCRDVVEKLEDIYRTVTDPLKLKGGR